MDSPDEDPTDELLERVDAPLHAAGATKIDTTSSSATRVARSLTFGQRHHHRCAYKMPER